MMNRRTLRKFRSPNDTKKFNELSRVISHISVTQFERLGSPSTGIPAKLISQFFFLWGGGGGEEGTPYSRLYTVGVHMNVMLGSPQGVLFDCLEEINQTEMYFWDNTSMEIKISKMDAATLLLMIGLPLLSKSERSLPV